MGWHDVRDGSSLKRALGSGETVVGSFIRLPVPEIAQICAHAGCDFVIIDTEHTPVGWERVSGMIVAAENAGTVPILRVSNPGRDLVTRGLDAGAHGVMIPQVESRAVAEGSVAATRYGPGGTRGTAGNIRSGFGMKMSYEEYVPAANAAMVVILQIESRVGVEAVEEIASVADIDCLFVGLTDLSVDLGHPGDYSHPEVDEYLDRILEAANAHGVPVGVPVSSSKMAASYIERGVRFVATSDVGLVVNGISRFIEEIDR